LLFAVAALVCSSVFGADEVKDAQSLKGLAAVRVVVEVQGREAQEHGLKPADLRADIESRLKKTGLQLLGEHDRAQGMPQLYLNVNVFPAGSGKDGLFVYSVDLSLIQDVRLIRAPNVRATAATWKIPGSLGTIEAKGISGLRSVVGEYADGFVSAHRAANPR
jgi:hypothetical protein